MTKLSIVVMEKDKSNFLIYCPEHELAEKIFNLECRGYKLKKSYGVSDLSFLDEENFVDFDV